MTGSQWNAQFSFLARRNQQRCKAHNLVLAYIAFVSLVATLSHGQTFTTLANFESSNGSNPTDVLLQGTDGLLYGATANGGAFGFGTAFTVTTGGVLSTLHSFDSTDGANPSGRLIQATDGLYYGPTANGGTYDDGTVFSITPTGAQTTLHSFCPQAATFCSDGSHPSPLVEAANRNFYGTAFYGGASGYGTVFTMTSNGNVTTLHSFNSNDGAYPTGGLFQATGGTLYGTATNAGAFGLGTIFTITPQGSFRTLHNFHGTDGFLPNSPLTEANNGRFYGTTYDGPDPGIGSSYKITQKGKFTTLHVFCLSICSDGGLPYGGLVQGTDGNLYGTNFGGGSDELGTIFMMTLSGTVTVLHTFAPGEGSPAGSLMQDTDGNFYGMTVDGGDLTCSPPDGCGTVYRLSVGLAPFVKTLPISATVGTEVFVLGTDLTGATGVKFSGISSSFTVESSTEITATVPTGATTGFLTVETPSGTLTSNKKFRVLP